MDDSQEVSLFSRQANPSRQSVEVRPMLPCEFVAVLDAWGMARGMNRTEALIAWVADRAREEHRKASLIVNASRGNPPLSDTNPMESV